MISPGALSLVLAIVFSLAPSRAPLGGSIGEVIDCVAGADVTLLLDGRIVAASRSDDFGDFKFDGLPARESTYEISIEKDGYGPSQLTVNVSESSYVGTILLARQ